ncbi:hypothetical protein [Sphingobacterium cellulitidis]|uniref:hypothetical protein n=1 Tax=Sphingobacterium cellulitidis TaxID=1768011 RepID=UPI003C7B987F
MKSVNKTLLFFKVIVLRLPSYYIPYVLILWGPNGISKQINPHSWFSDIIEIILVASIAGFFIILDFGKLYGFLVGFAIIYFGFQKLSFKSYCYTIFISNIIWMFGFAGYVQSFKEITQSILFVLMLNVPSAMIAITINWMVFRQAYKKIEAEQFNSAPTK